MVRMLLCLFAMGIFVSCGGGIELESVENGDREMGNNTGTNGRVKEGFQLHKNHRYGFDLSSNDKIVHISIPIDGTGYVSVLTDSAQAKDYDYYYCDPDNRNRLDLDYIPAGERQEHDLIINDSSPDKIGLCKEQIRDGVLVSAIQELQIHRYEWKNHDFYIYTFGARDMRNRFLEDDYERFWTGFDTVYRQAIVKRGSISRNFSHPIYIYDGNGTIERNYILSRARGNYEVEKKDGVECTDSDIGKAINEIENDVWTEKSAVIQVDYPTKRFWPLKINEEDEYSIEICGQPDSNEDPTVQQSPPIYLELEPLPNPDPSLDCKYKITPGIKVIWFKESWHLQYPDTTELATVDNADPKCAVFAEKNTYNLGRQYVGEIPQLAVAAMKREQNKKVATVILPWQGTLEATKRTAYHELGHTMGLEDVKETNLMRYINDTKSTQLRGRQLPTLNNKQESQWKCLQEIDINSNCASPDLIYREP